MTNKTNEKICLANLKGIEASLSILALNTEEKDSAKDLHEAMLLVGEVIKDLAKGIEELKN